MPAKVTRAVVFLVLAEMLGGCGARVASDADAGAGDSGSSGDAARLLCNNDIIYRKPGLLDGVDQRCDRVGCTAADPPEVGLAILDCAVEACSASFGMCGTLSFGVGESCPTGIYLPGPTRIPPDSLELYRCLGNTLASISVPCLDGTASITFGPRHCR